MPRRVLVPASGCSRKRVLRIGARLDVAPVAVQHVLARGDRASRALRTAGSFTACTTRPSAGGCPRCGARTNGLAGGPGSRRCRSLPSLPVAPDEHEHAETQRRGRAPRARPRGRQPARRARPRRLAGPWPRRWRAPAKGATCSSTSATARSSTRRSSACCSRTSLEREADGRAPRARRPARGGDRLPHRPRFGPLGLHAHLRIARGGRGRAELSSRAS